VTSAVRIKLVLPAGGVAGLVALVSGVRFFPDTQVRPAFAQLK